MWLTNKVVSLSSFYSSRRRQNSFIHWGFCLLFEMLNKREAFHVIELYRGFCPIIICKYNRVVYTFPFNFNLKLPKEFNLLLTRILFSVQGLCIIMMCVCAINKHFINKNQRRVSLYYYLKFLFAATIVIIKVDEPFIKVILKGTVNDLIHGFVIVCLCVALKICRIYKSLSNENVMKLYQLK